jgi:hypothetical protein
MSISTMSISTMSISAAPTPVQLDGRITAGRKGIPYDWQSLLAEAAVRELEEELASLGTADITR